MRRLVGSYGAEASALSRPPVMTAETADSLRHYQTETTAVVWGCGHSVDVYLAINPVVAVEQLAAYIQIDCLSCAKAKKVQTRGILWADVN